MALKDLSERERRVLEAVIQTYVETAEPAGSRTLSRRCGLGVSAATIRNTMSDLEDKGYLFHPHTSAGRVPTDMAYRVYVDSLVGLPALSAAERERLLGEIAGAGSAIEAILRRAAQSLGVLTQELGVALGPKLDQIVLERLELVRVSSDRVLVVLTLHGGALRTLFVEARAPIADAALAEVAVVLNERLAGLRLGELRAGVQDRLRDSVPTGPGAAELLNIFVQEGEQLFDVSLAGDTDVVLGQASVLAEQPEFASGDSLRRLMQLTETRAHLADILRRRSLSPGLSITIGNEHGDPRLDQFTLVTSEYRVGRLTGVIGVIGPTRMPYDKVIAMVHHTSQLLTELLD
ncbi:MAG TPA: heat-inducible transcriptional repressor HrcA [Gemmatimonadaceae bacterium]|nr:heat-inducible transcriptional repressor HrcA [Gemmatimonadaceae bacterium]